MTVSAALFQNEIAALARTFNAYANVKSELSLISTALATDTTTLDRTMQTPLGILYGSPAQTAYINRIDLLCNKGRAGNLSAAAMKTAVDNVVATLP